VDCCLTMSQIDFLDATTCTSLKKVTRYSISFFLRLFISSPESDSSLLSIGVIRSIGEYLHGVRRA